MENPDDFHAGLHRVMENQIAAHGDESEIGSNVLDRIVEERIPHSWSGVANLRACLLCVLHRLLFPNPSALAGTYPAFPIRDRIAALTANGRVGWNLSVSETASPGG